jgi:hypothetical protein
VSITTNASLDSYYQYASVSSSPQNGSSSTDSSLKQDHVKVELAADKPERIPSSPSEVLDLVQEIVSALRQKRVLMVLTLDQYLLVCETALKAFGFPIDKN